MKKMKAIVIAGIFITLINITAFSQELSKVKPLIIEPYPLAITYFKTTHLIFPYSIKSVDRGSKDVLAQKAKGVENVLQVKAGRKKFEETNLTVITTDGKLYSYTINYSDNPPHLNIQFTGSAKKAGNVFFSSSSINEAELMKICEKVSQNTQIVYRKNDKHYGMWLQLKGIYVKDDNLYFQISLRNQTNLNYSIDQFRFFIKDRKKAKRTASQEQEVNPVFVHNNVDIVKGRSEEVFVVVLPKFTIPDQKYFSIQVMEKQGGRHLKLKISNRIIVQSKVLKEQDRD